MGGASFFDEGDRFVLEALRQWTGRQAAGGGPPMDADRAQALAETLHCGQREASGVPLLDHIRRVAAAVPGDARALAWLHEALEHTPVSAEALLAEGLSLDELRGLRLLTRDKSSRSKARYLAHVKLIARAEGRAQASREASSAPTLPIGRSTLRSEATAGRRPTRPRSRSCSARRVPTRASFAPGTPEARAHVISRTTAMIATSGLGHRCGPDWGG
jgi:hypothetical protein